MRCERVCVRPTLLVVVALMAASIPAAPAAAQQSTVLQSARGRMRLVEPAGEAVLGQRLLVELTVAAAPPDEAQRAYLAWGELLTATWEEKAGERGSPNAVDPQAGSYPALSNEPWKYDYVLKGGRFVVPVVAPHLRTGTFELRLFVGSRLVDALPVRVGLGKAPNLVTGLRRVYRPGEMMEFTVDLPPNRFYWMGNGGPSLAVRALEFDSRPLTGEEAASAARFRGAWEPTVACDIACSTYLESVAKMPPAPDPPLEPWPIRPGPHVVQLPAPTRPGRYELRVTDRPYLADTERWFDFLVGDPVEFSVEAAGTSPTTLRFVKPVPTAPDRFAEIKDIAHGEPFMIEAAFAAVAGVSPPPERTATLEWVEGGATRSERVRMKRVSPTLYRSEPIVLTRPEGGR